MKMPHHMDSLIDGLEAFKRNSIGFFEEIPHYVPEARAWAEDRLFIGLTGWGLSSFNNAFVLDEHHLTAGDLAGVKAIFEEEGLPYSIIVFSHERVPACEPLLEAAGYANLYTDPLLSHQGPLHIGSHFPLEVLPAEGAAERRTFREIIEEAFEMPREFGADVFGRTMEIPVNRPYLGWADGAPVATGMLLLSGGVAAIFNVGTRLALRRRGIGTAMMGALHTAALAEGYDATVLLSTQIGFSLYLKLGYHLDGFQVTYVPGEYGAT